MKCIFPTPGPNVPAPLSRVPSFGLDSVDGSFGRGAGSLLVVHTEALMGEMISVNPQFASQ